jgi:hypothetical protein
MVGAREPAEFYQGERFTTTNHAFGPPAENISLKPGLASNRVGVMDSISQPSANAI